MLVSKFSFLLLASLAMLVYLSTAALLPISEVHALQKIAQAIGKTNWNFNADPCSGKYGWNNSTTTDAGNAVNCGCSQRLCHVNSIALEAQNLRGTLPKDLSGLPFLQQLILKRNFLNGTIPREWGSSKLVNLSISGNRITGSIPKELGNISTLEILDVQNNQLTGELPRELGKLTSIKNMYFVSNNFTGELPAELAKLTTLENFQTGGNQFSGVIPDFIQKWKHLTHLYFVASGLSGPIPSGISKLNKITDLRITDLSGPETTFPKLDNMTKITHLFLRNCNLKGAIPDYLKDMSELKDIDLSFNKLNGKFPSGLTNLKNISNIFVTGNMLTGHVPEEVYEQKNSDIDLSYNNFTTEISECQKMSVNLFAASSGRNISGTPSCLKISECTKTSYDLYINCGGPSVKIKDTQYEVDVYQATASSFWKSNTGNWAVSTTGMFTDDNNPNDVYILRNTTRLTMENPELYMTARLTPVSLTYYAFCLGNGSYTVKLHFAETLFTNDQTNSNLGRRVFDVYIQGKLVLKDFDIAAEAGGTGKPLVKKFFANVAKSTRALEIRFYWAGKGTTIIPKNGVYGVLISAISIHHNFVLPVTVTAKTKNSISIGAAIGIAAAGALAVLAIAGLLWWKLCLRKKSHLHRDLEGLDLNTGKFTLRQIKAATNNFDVANKIGEGGFGSVYKGHLLDGTIIAVKQLSSKSKQGNREFLNEIGMISALQHPHLVRLYGCCIEGDQLSLVYEFMQNNNVGRALFGPIASQIQLDWPTRSKICIGIARGLAFLHEESRLKIVHRDIKATNILLDKNFDPKISDFGLAKLDEEDNTHMSTRIAGTYGYMAPEYAMRGHLTDKADVYSYGIVVLEIVSGRSNTTYRARQENFYVLDWARFLEDRDNLLELVDPRLGTDYNREEVLLTIKLALQCASVSPEARPSMSSVLSVLEGKALLEDIMIADEVSSKNDLDEMRRHYEAIQEDSQTHSMLLDGPWTASYSSVPDLYPVNPNSDYYGKSRN